MGVSADDLTSVPVPGADPAVVGPWLADRLGDPAWRDCALAPVGAGRSNLTYRVQSPAGAVVLRRPPVGQVAATAHDMGRERRIISGLADSDVPVPAVLAWSDGGPPVDAPCYVMELVEGVVPAGALPAGWAETPEERGRAADALVDVLVRLHSVDPAAHGLADFGRPEGFMARQVRRWVSQWEHARPAVPEEGIAEPLQSLADDLAAALPTTQRHTIVHGDYKLENCIFAADDPGTIAAVLDWEMSTLGDPLADLGLLLIYWRQSDDPAAWRDARGVPGITALPGFPSRAGITERYAAATGLDVSPLPWYVAFGAFKLAVVLAGIVARVRTGMVPETMAVDLGSVLPLVTLGQHVLAEGLD
ncbi:phosphotransferase family protein [Pseudonocardia lacus]|uniref:phosphotransferase family protein n=1 Tax=Pseudonocardia lacus TaxID=2835865 RepID=UPI0027E36643|nr:phosphotransferase family protein [Pseudonocardia lacus]